MKSWRITSCLSTAELGDNSPTYILCAVLILVRFAAAWTTPLFYGDEPYYWLWSKHLAWGYFDHPPVVAWIVRLGTTLFGDTEFGVRFVPLALSIPISLCVWRTGRLLLGGRADGARSVLFFNLTLMAASQTFLATPDAPVIACTAALLWSLAELAVGRDGRWWLAAGLFAGLGMLSKFTALFVGAGGALWILCHRDTRVWLRTPWPWLGAAIAAVVFTPNVVWNADHGWDTYRFQFGRVQRSHNGWWYLPEFIGEQLLLASPALLALAVRGTWLELRSRDERRLLTAACIWPAVLYFAIHALHDRVHRNWIDVVYPALAVAAADAWRDPGTPRWLRSAVLPGAAVLLLLVYAEVFVPFVPIGLVDPLNQRSIASARGLAGSILAARDLAGAKVLIATEWETTAWLRFHLPPDQKVIQGIQEFRFADFPRPTDADLAGPLLYVSLKRDLSQVFAEHFETIEPLASVLPPGTTLPATPFTFYRLSGLRGATFGRLP